MDISRFTKNLFANSFSQVWNAILGIIFIPLYVKLIGSESYGLVGFFGSFNILLSFLDLGLSALLSREFALSQRGSKYSATLFTLFRTVEILVLIIAFFFFLLIFNLSPWLSKNWFVLDSLNPSTVEICINYMGLIISLRLIEGIYKSVFYGLQKHVLINVINVIFSTSRSIGVIGALIWISSSIKFYFLWQMMSFALPVFVYAFLYYRSFSNEMLNIRFSLKSLKGNWKFAGGMFYLSIVSMFITQLDKVFLSRSVSLSEFGLYSIASSVSFMILFVSYPIVNTYYPILVELHNSETKLRFKNNFHKASQLVSFLASSLAFFLFFFTKEILVVWGLKLETVHSIEAVVKLLVLGNLMSAVILIPYQVYIAAGKIRLIMSINTFLVFIFPLLYFFSSKSYGTLGAAVIYSLFNITYFIIMYAKMSSSVLFCDKIDWLKQDVLKIIIVAFVSTFLMKLIYGSFYFKDENLSFLIFLFGINLFIISKSSKVLSVSIQNFLKEINFGFIWRKK